MSREAKIIVGLVAGLFVLCVCAAGAGLLALAVAGDRVARSVQTAPERVAVIGGEIAGFEIPAGRAPSPASAASRCW